jgi:hypothetical protein
MLARILTLLLVTTLAAMADSPSTPSSPLDAVHQKVVHDLMWYGIGIAIISGVCKILGDLIFEKKRAKRKKYYNEDYLQSDAWQRKRYVVFKRDNWKCVYCDAKATDVHHKRYARQIGKEPIDWLVSVCPRCHAMEHPEKQTG